MIDDIVRDFWQHRAATGDASIRWTDRRMLDLDLDLVRRALPTSPVMLDLGCGTGDLFLPLLDELVSVTAVDMIAEFLERIPDDTRITKIRSEVTEYAPEPKFNVAVMFGVVTHLRPDEEVIAYRILRQAVPAGIVVVKNQCGLRQDLEIDGWSDAFSSRYVARYPYVDRQAERLATIFDEVEVVRYPNEVNNWENSLHVAFVCR